MGWKMANFFGFVLFFCCLKCFPIWFWRFKRKWHARWWRGRHSSSCGYHHAWSTQASNSQQHTPSARSQVIFFGYILHFILPSLNDIWEDRRRRPRMSFYYKMYIIILSGGAAAAETHRSTKPIFLLLLFLILIILIHHNATSVESSLGNIYNQVISSSYRPVVAWTVCPTVIHRVMSYVNV